MTMYEITVNCLSFLVLYSKDSFSIWYKYKYTYFMHMQYTNVTAENSVCM